eukprot:NODE_16182_length_1008_cov_2.726447.p1 GENE.NODE_16182_length_1008_cov_2.726447~~NODE_16182_length_1008_cov_2.726447.p1  ORF type:complete len:230 (-),score=78.05 NODE_16182_length_1008_cov_2.726447:149-838(-)
MVAKGLMAIVRHTPRRNSSPVLAALLPQAEREDTGWEQARPPGFHMVLLPWADDFRNLRFPPPADLDVPPRLIEAARRSIDAMRVDAFAPGCVENPVLQKHYACVQALALGEAAPEKTADLLHPHAEALAEHASVLADWRAAIDDAAPAALAPPSKRACGEAGGRPAKVRREEMPGLLPGATEAEVRDLVVSGVIDRVTVGALRDWLAAHSMPIVGKKADLIERIRASC